MAVKPSAEIAVRISALDEYSAMMNRFGQDLAKMREPLERTREMMRAGGREHMFDDAAKGLRVVRERAVGALGGVSMLAPGLAALGGAATVAGIARMATSFGEAGLSLGNTARLAGTSAAGLNSLRGAATLTGLSAQTADSAMLGLNQTLSDAAYGKNADAATWFRRFGIDFGNMRDGAKSAESALPGVVRAITQLSQVNPIAATHLMELWHIPAEALPMFMKGTDELARQRAEASKLSGATKDQVDAAERYTAAQGRMTLAGEGLRNQLVTRLEPAITAGLTSLSDWIGENNKTALSIDTITTAAEALGATAVFRMLFGGKAFGVAAKMVFGGGVGTAVALTSSLKGDAGPNSDSPQAISREEAKRLVDADNAKHREGWFRRMWKGATGSEVPTVLERLGEWGSNATTLRRDDFFAQQRERTILVRADADRQRPSWADVERRRGIFGVPSDGGAQPGPEDARYKPVLDMLAHGEGTDRGRGYNETLAYGRWTGGNQDLTGMTLDQIDSLQTSMLDKQRAAGIGGDTRSSALGRYQFTQTTLRDMRQKYGFRGDQVFDPQMQDHLAVQRIKMGGGLSQAVLAGGWASVPDAGSGRSRYGQRTGVSSADVQEALNRVAHGPVQPPPPRRFDAPPAAGPRVEAQAQPVPAVVDRESGQPITVVQAMPPQDAGPRRPGTLNQRPADNAGQGGNVTVRVHLTSDPLPTGMGARVIAEGNGVDPPNINLRRAMPRQGAS